MPAISRLLVNGFHDLTYRDKLRDNNEFKESDELKRVTAETDRLYYAPEGDLVVTLYTANDELSSSSSSEIAKTPFMEVSKSASLSDVVVEGISSSSSIADVPCDVVFWNPWIEKSLTLADLDNEAYLNFVCVEPGTVRDWVTVPPQKQLRLSQTLTSL